LAYFKVRIAKTRAEKEEEQRRSATDRVVAIVAIVTSIAAIASAIAAHIDARESLAAQIRSVDAQISTSQASVTPVVSIIPDAQGTVIIPQSDGAEEYHVPFTVTARGQTPAINIGVQSTCEPALTSSDQPKPRQGPVQHFAILGDHDAESYARDFEVRAPSAMRMHASVSYADLFGRAHSIAYRLTRHPSRIRPEAASARRPTRQPGYEQPDEGR
jgi:hypothetical protein